MVERNVANVDVASSTLVSRSAFSEEEPALRRLFFVENAECREAVLISYNLMNSWFVYILKCADNSLYTGITNNIKSRLSKHINGKGAKYTKIKGVKKLVYSEKFKTKSKALKREMEIKGWSRKEKLVLTKGKR